VLTDTQRNALFIDVHRAIELAADHSAAALTGQAVAAEPEYPPNGGYKSVQLSPLCPSVRSSHRPSESSSPTPPSGLCLRS